jgi:raffinose synthase
MGSGGREVPYETQFMLLQGPADNYTVLLPVLDGAFRACLQGNAANELQLCVESGEPANFSDWECAFVITFSFFFNFFL